MAQKNFPVNKTSANYLLGNRDFDLFHDRGMPDAMALISV
jgi:hypothetical protein